MSTLFGPWLFCGAHLEKGVRKGVRILFDRLERTSKRRLGSGFRGLGHRRFGPRAMRFEPKLAPSRTGNQLNKLNRTWTISMFCLIIRVVLLFGNGGSNLTLGNTRS